MGSTRLSTRMVAALLLGVLLWPAWAAAEQRVALVIGNGKTVARFGHFAGFQPELLGRLGQVFL